MIQTNTKNDIPDIIYNVLDISLKLIFVKGLKTKKVLSESKMVPKYRKIRLK